MSQTNFIKNPKPGFLPSCHPLLTDQQFLRLFESHLLPRKPKLKVSHQQLWDIKEKFKKLVEALTDLKVLKQSLEAIYHLNDEEWHHFVESIETNKSIIERTCKALHKRFAEVGKKIIKRRFAKRRRLQRRSEYYEEYSNLRLKLREENSRRINENLLKIQEDILKAKEAEAAKKQADMVLKDVLRRQADAKKSIAKLDALMELRRARLNTAKGAGQVVPENDDFNTQIEKLKALWIYKLTSYEVEEEQLRAKLQEAQQGEASIAERIVRMNLGGWLKFMFGSCEFPQYDFKGDVQKFIEVRRGWDQFIDNGPESTPIPIGWVMPKIP